MGMTGMRALLLAAAAGGAVAAQSAHAATPAPTAGPGAAACTALAGGEGVAWPEPGTRVLSADWRPAGPFTVPAPPGAPPMPAVTLPAHCEIVGIMHERTGVDGQRYAIRFHVRLPAQWNGNFFMQGGGGTNGELGDAIGRLNGGASPALAQGYAVMSQDSGHDNGTNTVPARNGASAFGFDPQARADYGGTSLPPSVTAAKAAIRAFYGHTPGRSYFVGCSKGGQEGMMLATRYPTLFDGIVATAPGFALPRAAVAEAWDTQALAQVVKAKGEPLTLTTLAQSFSQADSALVARTILAACDKDDGAADGMVADFTRCTSEKVLSELARVTCAGAKQDGCLLPAQVEALRRIHEGARGPDGKSIYAPFFWDAGWGDAGWRIWKIGGGPVPAINVMMGSPSLAAVFTTPPTVVADNPQAKLDYLMHFDFGADAAKIYATGEGFPRSAWADIGARTPDLDAFKARGGKLIVPQGASDPVFSLADTIAWYKDVNKRYGGGADGFVRVFGVPGMNHCAGGPSTDGFDAFAALVGWVEQDRAPDQIEARAGPQSPWPDRTRPLCPYPKVARYKGAGSLEKATSFVCS